MVVWDAGDGGYRGCVKLGDVCGLAAGPGSGRFVATTGRGGIHGIDARDLAVTRMRSPVRGALWDNHLATITSLSN